MGIIGWVVLGLLAGVIAKKIMPGAERIGIVITTLLGIGGALLGGFIATALGFGDPIDEFFDLSTWLAAVLGALILLYLSPAGTSPTRRRATSLICIGSRSNGMIERRSFLLPANSTRSRHPISRRRSKT